MHSCIKVHSKFGTCSLPRVFDLKKFPLSSMCFTTKINNWMLGALMQVVLGLF